MVTGTNPTAIGGTTHRPIPTVAPGARLAHAHTTKPKATGLDWDNLRPKCRNCGQPSGELDNADHCPTCRGQQPAPEQTPQERRDAAYDVLHDDEIESRFTAPASTPAAPAPAPVTPTAAAPPAIPPVTSATAASLDRLCELLMAATQAAHQVRAALTPAAPAAATQPAAPRTPGVEKPRGRTGGRRIELPAADVAAAYTAGQTAEEIAAQHGVSHMTVLRVLKEAGVARRGSHVTRTPELVAEIRRLYVDEGLTQAEVAQRLGHSSKVVQSVIAEHGIPTRPAAPRAGHHGGGAASQARRQQIADLGATTAQVKAWALQQGLIDRISRGLPRQDVIDAYAAAHTQKATA